MHLSVQNAFKTQNHLVTVAPTAPSVKRQLSDQNVADSCSSVAREGGGGSSLPIGLKSMQNSVFLAVLRLILSKNENSPLKEIEVRLGKILR